MSVRFGKAAAAAAALGAVVIAGAAVAHDVGPAPKTPAGKAAAARHDNFKQVGAAFKAINDEARKGSPDQAALAANAQKLNGLARQMGGWFPKGSGAESGVKTHAKPDVWSDPQGFAAAVQKLQGATGQLQQVTASGDAAGLKAQVQATGGACKGCHDKFRVPDKT
ncbi:cytochrome c [Phenylobacterium sp. LjRoot219]|uniref:c-type cytochrome n=1 Tax=Phenylobacterium sp. LjRoot219 TaxID=3342283 RepID=UPI003ED0A4D9